MAAKSKGRQFGGFLMEAGVPLYSFLLVYAVTLDAFPGCKFKPLPSTFNPRIKVIWEFRQSQARSTDRKWTAHHYDFG